MPEESKDIQKESIGTENKVIILPKDLAVEFLSNERTFLAWIRTSIAVISLGFVIAKFGIWLEDLSLTISPKMAQLRTGVSVPIGISMVVLGGLLSILAAWRYHKVNHQIEQGEVKADRGLIIIITLLVLILSIMMVVYMISATGQF